MSFQTGLSGLNASSKSLDVIGNNIANANTVGMKSSRAEFADLVASSLGSGGGGAGAGIGVAVATIAQQFSQGNINITGNSLDVAINGNGFFEVARPDGSTAFTRDGQFKLDKDGNIITNTGAKVMGYTTDITTGVPTSVTPAPLSVPTSAPIPANPTGSITAEFNLDARVPTATPLTSPTQYGTSLTTYDSQGVAIPLSLYFVKSGVDTWSAFTDPTVAQTAVTSSNYATRSFQMTFSPTGKLTAPLVNPTMTLTSPNPNIGAFTANLDVSKVTQFGVGFNVSNLSQDGYTAGELTGISIEPSGVITTRYSNGETQYRGQLALADFRNVQGLAPIGSGEYLETFVSGQPVLGNPGIGKYGELRAGAVEESNVDLTAELVNMMTAQRNYQANAQTIKTQDQIMSTLVNLR